MIASSSSQAVWYLTRGTGVVALILLTAVTVLGIVSAVRWSPAATPRFVVQRVHRNVSLLSVVFIVVHVATAIVDGFAPIRWLDAVVPFRSAYRPIWLGLGTVAFDLVIAVVVTSLLRARLGYRAWRAVHWTSYALWAVAVFHGLGIGSDAKEKWMIGLVALSVGAVVAAAVWRVAVGWPGWSPARLVLAVGAVAMPVVLIVWFVAGPLRPGWAARAGTPEQLLSHTKPTGSTIATKPVTPPTPIVLPSQAAGTGTTQLERQVDGGARVTVTLRTTGPSPMSIVTVLNGRPIPGGGITMSDGTATLTPAEGAAPYQGGVTGLEGDTITADLSDGHGDRIVLTLQLVISQSGQTQGQVYIQAVSTEAQSA